jgi:hypothetical protein
MNQRMLATRRSFLRAVGAGFAALPCFRLLENNFAQAQGAELPLKFITVYMPHGICAEYYNRGQRGTAPAVTETETDFDITYTNCVLQPFDDAATYGKSFKDKILTIDGMELLSGANGHETSGTILTGSRISGKPANSSLDHFLAVERGLGADTRLANVNLGVGNDALDTGNTLSFGVGGEPLPKIIDPVQSYQQLFRGVVAQGDPDGDAALARQNLLGQGMVDYLRGDVNRLRTRLAGSEKLKLDQHMSSLEELEKQFQSIPSGAGCTVPAQPDASAFPHLKQYNQGERYFDAITNAQIDLLAQAMACDVTRFATLFMNDLSYEGNPLGLAADNHGGVAHAYSASTVGNNNHPADGSPDTWLPLAKMNKYSFGKVARLMQKLDQLGILDSTLIYVSSDMGNASGHSSRNVPTVLAGGANGKFRMGRRIALAADCPPGGSDWCTPMIEKTNNHLLVSIAQAFGQSDVESFGTQPEPALTTGELTEIA